MTTPEDEIANLRTALSDLRAWCCHELTYGQHDEEAVILLNTVRDMGKRGLKTPRASKIVHPDTLRLDWVLKHALISWDRNCDTGRAAKVSNLYTREHIDAAQDECP